MLYEVISQINKGRRYRIIGDEKMRGHDVVENMCYVGPDKMDCRFHHFAREGRKKSTHIKIITIDEKYITNIKKDKINLSIAFLAATSIGKRDPLYEECLEALGGKIK